MNYLKIISDVHPRSRIRIFSDPGSQIPGSKKFRIANPQHGLAQKLTSWSSSNMKPSRQGESLPPVSIFSQCSRTTNLRNKKIHFKWQNLQKHFRKGQPQKIFFVCSFQPAPTQPLFPGASLVNRKLANNLLPVSVTPVIKTCNRTEIWEKICRKCQQ